MPIVEVLKFGSSVLRSTEELAIAVDEIYRRWRSGYRILAVVSAFDGVTDRLIGNAERLFGTDCPEATASYVATGEQQTAALLVGSLVRCGIPARFVNPSEIALIAEGSPLESAPTAVDTTILELLWNNYAVLVLPGFFGTSASGQVALFGRGGSDLSALFLAAELGGACRLLKDVCGVFNDDPARDSEARRFSSLSWATAVDVAGPLIQPKALRYAQTLNLPFEVGRPNEDRCTLVGGPADRLAPTSESVRRLRVVLLGCGIVGRGVYDAIKRYPERFEICHVVVRHVERHADVSGVTTDLSVVLGPSIDVVIECFGGVERAYPLIAAAVMGGKFVITANKAVVAAHWNSLSRYACGNERRLWFSAAVGGALPALETISGLQIPICEIRAVINGTCGVVLDALALGKTRAEAIESARDAGFCEADPSRDLSGQDSADKLALMIQAAFGIWVAPSEIPIRGIDSIPDNPGAYKMIARARRSRSGVSAFVAPERSSPDSFLGQATGPENRLEIELETGELIRLRGQGAGRWPTTISVLGDLHEVARIIETGCSQGNA